MHRTARPSASSSHLGILRVKKQVRASGSALSAAGEPASYRSDACRIKCLPSKSARVRGSRVRPLIQQEPQNTHTHTNTHTQTHRHTHKHTDTHTCMHKRKQAHTRCDEREPKTQFAAHRFKYRREKKGSCNSRDKAKKQRELDRGKVLHGLPEPRGQGRVGLEPFVPRHHLLHQRQ